MIKGILFDMDGLMFDTERLDIDAWVYIGRQMGYHITAGLPIKTLGLNYKDTKSVFLDALGYTFDYDGLKKMRDMYVYNRIEQEGMPIKPGLFELLNFLKSGGYKMTVATSSEREKAIFYFQKAGIADFFGEIVCGDMILHGKPEPDIYLKACEVIDVAPDACIALEDSPAGLLSAFRAGVKPVMIPDLLEPDDRSKEIIFSKLPTLFDVIGLLEAHCR
jgi:haloacid dehalogenase superfamily, subfamily IA, variant 3 with third motif having DD or ED/haloacid dehalogenase superfamily, subfamily IA, variant 1 with third motif having Dx(3-4)D or Dx(3-4)E